MTYWTADFAFARLKMGEEQLIEAVGKKICLWRMVSSLSYKDLRAKENAWKEVALEVQCFRSALNLFSLSAPHF